MKEETLQILLREFGRINERFDKVFYQFEQIDRRFEQIDQRFEQIDQRFEQIDRRFEQMDQRITDLEKNLIESIDSLENRTAKGFKKTEERFEILEFKVETILEAGYVTHS